jgi:hypothetical protein
LFEYARFTKTLSIGQLILTIQLINRDPSLLDQITKAPELPETKSAWIHSLTQVQQGETTTHLSTEPNHSHPDEPEKKSKK